MDSLEQSPGEKRKEEKLWMFFIWLDFTTIVHRTSISLPKSSFSEIISAFEHVLLLISVLYSEGVGAYWRGALILNYFVKQDRLLERRLIEMGHLMEEIQ